MKTIIARFEDMKKDPMAILEDGVSANKVEAALATIGIALRDSEGEFRALQDVMDELGMKWNSLTRNQQAYIATVSAGSRQQSRFLALMNNYDRTLDLITESQNSAGAAAQQYAIYQDSIAAAQARLTASWEKFYSKIVDNGAIKTAINGLASLVDILSHVPPIITAIGVSIGALGLQNLFKSFTATNSPIFSVADRFKTLFEESKKANISFKDLRTDAPKLTEVFKSLASGIKGTGNTLLSTSKAFAAFALQNWKWIAAAALIAAAIYGITRALGAQKRAYEDNLKAIQNYQEKAERYKDEINTSKELLNTYNDLATITNRTAEEQTELNNTINQLVKLYPKAISYMDEYGNMHLENTDALQKEIEKTEELYNMQRKQSLESRRSLITGDTRYLTDNDFSSIGYNSEATKRFLYYQDLMNQAVTANVGINAFRGNILLNDVNRVREIPVLDKNSKATSTAIRDINEAINLFGLSLEKLDTKSTWAEVFDKADEIEEYRKKLSKETEFYRDEINKAKQDMLRETNIELSFLDLSFNGKEGTAGAQRAVAAQLRSFFSSMGNESYEAFTQSFGTTSLADFVQEALNRIENVDEGIEAKGLIEKVLNPKNFDKDLEADFKRLGILMGQEFVDGLKLAQQQEIDRVWNNTLESFEKTFGKEATEKYNKDNTDQKTMQSMVEVGKDWKTSTGEKLTVDQAAELAQAAQELQKLYDEKTKEGTVSGWERGVAEIAKDNSLEGIVLDAFTTQAEGMSQVLNEDIINKSFDEAQTKIQEFFATYKENIDNLISGTNDKAIDKGLTSSDDNVFLNPETGELIVSITQSLAELEKERLNLVEDLVKQYDDVSKQLEELQNSDKKLTEEEKRRKEQLTNQLEILNQEAIILEEIAAKSEVSGWGKSLQLAEQYQDKISTINEIQESLKEQTFLDISDMKQILDIMPEYANQFQQVQEGIYTVTAETIEAMKQEAKSEYEYHLALERQKAEEQYLAAKAEYDSLAEWAAQIGIIEDEKTKKAIAEQEKQVRAEKKKDDNIVKLAGGANKAAGDVEAQHANNLVSMIRQALSQIGEDIRAFIDSEGNIHWDQVFTGIQNVIDKDQFKLQVGVEFNKDNFIQLTDDYESVVRSAMGAAQARMDAAFARLQTLQKIDVPELEKLKKQLSNTSKSSDKTGKDLEKLAKMAEDAAKSIEKLNESYLNLTHDLNAIKPDYNPFTDLFEAWEKEWDYYYNIKRLIQELGQQGQYIDNIISADFTTADRKVSGYHAKIGNLIAQMAANDTYITSLRTGMSQTALELMKEYGEYYKVDPNSGQIFQTDKNLNEINTTINAAKEELYNLSKIQNEKQNELSTENSKLEVLEKEKSAYDSILNEIESQIDSYKNLDDVIVDTSELEANRSVIKAKIEISDKSIEAQKEKIRNMEDEIQELEIEVTLKGNIESDLEEYVQKMEEKVQEYEEYWETLNSTIAEQQDILNQLNEVYSYYVDTAISTQQDLYNAIVENYQNEINQKKEQYDYLKQLDKDYLNSVKNSISQERQAREDSNRQKSYQQSLQRMQLLQQETSGAYRNEISQLGKEIEDQRQELYDDLVDKQVEALEKEINKRHELYDKEVAALEERLAYMQENAILLWEMVNTIMAEGTESMMSQLETTVDYINTNELNRQKQRKQWEQNIKITYDGVVNNQINNINTMVEKGRDYIDSLKEIRTSIETNIETYKDSTHILIENNANFQTAMDSFMTEWNRITNAFTGYYESWEQTVSALKIGLDNNLQALIDMNNEGGSIRELDNSLRDNAKKLYDDFIEERQRYRDELNNLIQRIRDEISSAISSAASAIRGAAGSMSTTPNDSNITSGTGGTGGYGSNNTITQTNGTSLAASSSTIINRSKEFYREEYVPLNANYHNHIIFYTIGPTETKKEPHEWEYISSTKRRCKKCGYEEIQIVRNLKAGANSSPQIMMEYASGGVADYSGMAWLDGSPSNPERVLSPHQTKLFESMVNSLEKSTNSNINSSLGSSYNIGDIVTNIQVNKLDNEMDVNRLVKQVEDKIIKTIRNRVVVSV